MDSNFNSSVGDEAPQTSDQFPATSSSILSVVPRLCAAIENLTQAIESRFPMTPTEPQDERAPASVEMTTSTDRQAATVEAARLADLATTKRSSGDSIISATTGHPSEPAPTGLELESSIEWDEDEGEEDQETDHQENVSSNEDTEDDDEYYDKDDDDDEDDHDGEDRSEHQERHPAHTFHHLDAYYILISAMRNGMFDGMFLRREAVTITSLALAGHAEVEDDIQEDDGDDQDDGGDEADDDDQDGEDDGNDEDDVEEDGGEDDEDDGAVYRVDEADERGHDEEVPNGVPARNADLSAHLHFFYATLYPTGRGRPPPSLAARTAAIEFFVAANMRSLHDYRGGTRDLSLAYHAMLYIDPYDLLTPPNTITSHDANDNDDRPAITIPRLMFLAQLVQDLVLRHADDASPEDDPDCPICFKPYAIPVKSRCGHFFCGMCVTKWLVKETSCPMCRVGLRTWKRDGESSSEEEEDYSDGEDDGEESIDSSDTDTEEEEDGRIYESESEDEDDASDDSRDSEDSDVSNESDHADHAELPNSSSVSRIIRTLSM